MCKVQRPCQQNRALLRQPRLPRAPHPLLIAQQLEELYLLTPKASTQLSIASGTTLKIVNTDDEAHTATADNDLFDTGVLKPGESKEVYFEGAGSVTYHDALHPNMKGSIVVGEGGGAADTTAAP